MVDWQMLEGIGGIATAVAVVFAVVFGWTQFRQLEAQRRQAAMHHYFAAFTQPHIIHAIQNIMQLPDDAPPDLIRSDPQLRDDFTGLAFVIEEVGTFVHSRAADLHEADRICGGFVRGAWRKVRVFVEAERAHWPNLGEWWQWLVERMDEDPAPGKLEGAHIAFRSWKR